MKNIFKVLAFFLIPLLLNACGGGGGGGSSGGGASSGAAASYTVPACSDTGTAFQTNEYYTIGSNSGQRSNQLSLVCASSAYARGSTGDGIKIAIVDSGGPWDAAGNISNGEFNSTASDIVKPSNSDYVNSDSVPNDDNGHGSGVACMVRCDKGDGDMHGIAYNSILSFYKVSDANGSFVNNSTLASALNAADSNDIINNSWGANTDCTSISTCTSTIGSSLYAAMKTATETNGKILVWASGNYGGASPQAKAKAVFIFKIYY